MINKRITLLIVACIILSVTLSSVSATENNKATSNSTTKLQKSIMDINDMQNEETKHIDKVFASSVKKDITYYVATDGKSSNEGTQSSPYDLNTAISKVRNNHGGNLILKEGTYDVDEYIGMTIEGTYTITAQTGNKVTLNGKNRTRILWATDNVNLEIRNITFANANEYGLGAAIRKDGEGVLKIIDCNFINNQASNGGAIHSSTKNLTITGCTFENNKATGSGAAIHNAAPQAKITLSTFINNIASFFGGALINKENSINIINNTFSNNQAKSGGSIAIYKVDNTIISKNTFNKNTASTSAGAIYIEGNNNKVINNRFMQNTAPNAGSILTIRSKSTQISSNEFRNCTATDGSGGAITLNTATNTELSLNTFTNNTAKLISHGTGNGASVVIYPTCSKTTVKNNNFTSNYAEESGAAVSSASSYSTIKNNNFIQNRANHGSGAMYIEANYVNITDNFFNKQQVPGDGAGVYIRGNNCMVANNRMTENSGRSGTLYFDGSNNTATNNIIAYNNASSNGAGIYTNNNSGTVIKSNVISNNVAQDKGSAIALNIVNKATITKNNITNNAARVGGAIANNQVTNTTIAYNIFENNTSKTSAGAIITYESTSYIIIQYNNFTKNTAKDSAGALMINGTNNQILSNNFTKNIAINGWGGAISVHGINTSIIESKFLNNTANTTVSLIIDASEGTIRTNNINETTSESYGTIYNVGKPTIIKDNIFEDIIVKTKAKLIMDKINGIIGENVTLSVSVKNKIGKKVNGGSITFKYENGKVIKSKIPVKNGKATYTFKANSNLRNSKVYAVYTGSYRYLTSTSSLVKTHVLKRNASLIMKVMGKNLTHYRTVKLTAKVRDTSTNKNIADGENYVTFKVNGISIKNKNGNPIMVRVKKGVATYKYTVPIGLAAYENGKIKKHAVTATLTSPCYSLKTKKGSKFIISRSNLTIKNRAVVINRSSNNLIINTRLVDGKGKQINGTNKLRILVNNKTVKINNKQYAVINNGAVSLTTSLPANIHEINNISFIVYQSNVYNTYRTQAKEIIYKNATKISMNKVNGVYGQKVRLTASINDVNGDKVSEGTVFFKYGSNKTLKSNVNIRNGRATCTVKAPEGLISSTVYATYSGSNNYFATNSSKIKSHITQRNASIKTGTSTKSSTHYKTIKLTAKVTDTSTGKTIRNSANNYVTFKINGASIKNSAGKIVHAKIRNGIAQYNYVIPAGLHAYTKDNQIKKYNVTAKLHSPTYKTKHNVNALFRISRSNLSIQENTVLVNMTSRKLRISANIKDSKLKQVKTNTKLKILINNKVLKINNRINTTIKNGKISLVLNIPKTVKKIKSLTFFISRTNAYNTYKKQSTKLKIVK